MKWKGLLAVLLFWPSWAKAQFTGDTAFQGDSHFFRQVNLDGAKNLGSNPILWISSQDTTQATFVVRPTPNAVGVSSTVPTDALSVGGSVNAAVGYKVGTVPGISGSCGGGSFVSTFTVSGGVITSVTCGMAISTATTGFVPNALLDASSITKQGNTFNGATQLVRTDSSGRLPAIDGSQLTGLTTYAGPMRTTWEFTSSGLWTKPSNVSMIDIYCIAGAGGGGGGNTTATGGGGGAGGVKISSRSVTGNIFVLIGAGGAGGAATANGTAGSNTIFGSTPTIVMTGGGGGGGPAANGANGGSGGGAGATGVNGPSGGGGGASGPGQDGLGVTAANTGGVGTAGQGNDGGDSAAAASGIISGGNGGPGLLGPMGNSIGSCFAGGGGGASASNAGHGACGGGNATEGGVGNNAVANTGSGGGGAQGNFAGGNGSAGYCLVTAYN